MQQYTKTRSPYRLLGAHWSLFNDVVYIETTLNEDLKIITKWAKQWLVTFNPKKTEALFCSLLNVDKPLLYFDNVELNYIQHHKHLGLTLSEDGTWHEHIANITKSASKVFGSMRLLKFRLNRKTLNQIYISYMRPILEKTNIIWDSCAF